VLCRRDASTGGGSTRAWLGVGLAAVLVAGTAGAYVLRPIAAAPLLSVLPAQALQASPMPDPRPLSAAAPTDLPVWPKPLTNAKEPAIAAGTPSLGAAQAPAESPPEPEPTAEPAPAPSLPTRVANTRVHVVVYTTSWCPHCREAKAWMASRGLDYEERDIEASMENERQMKLINPRGGIPTFDVEGNVMVGFSPDALDALLKRAIRQQADRL